jgi:FkbH-like protein
MTVRGEPLVEADLWREADALAGAGDLPGAVGRLLVGYRAFPVYRYALQLSRWVAAHPTLEDAYPAARHVRVALLGSSTLEPLRAFVEAECLRAGLWPQIYVGGFNQYRSEILAEDSPFVRAKPEVVFLALTTESLLPGTDAFGSIARDRVTEAVEAVQGLADGIHRRLRTLLVVHNFTPSAWAEVAYPGDKDRLSARRFVQELNLRLADAFATSSETLVFDFESLAAAHGLRHAVDAKMRHLAGMEIAESVLPELARRQVGYLKTLKGLARKCVVLDLDGTLWGGVIGEDGLDGIHLGDDPRGRPYGDFQRYLLALWERGILLAVNSKNNPDDAMQAITAHPGMVLRERHFASTQINWDDKATNVLRIAEELNIGVDSLIFVDDNPAERLRMRQQLPEVLTVDLPRNPSRYIETLAGLNDLQPLTVTAEDRRRGAQYGEERARRDLKARATSFDEYLRELKMRVTLRAPRDGELARVAQLTQKTNQFNLTTRRYSAAELIARGRGVILRMEDAFGDHGLVGFALLDERRGDAWHLDTFLMSCRVLGRGVEQLFVERLAAQARRAGAGRLTAEYVPTPKNGMAADFYPTCGFRVAGTEGGVRRYELSLDGLEPAVPDWLTLIEHDAPDGPAMEKES